MIIRVNLYATLRDLTGWSSREFSVEETELSLRDFILRYLGDIGERICKEFYSSGSARYTILINGVNILMREGLDTKLRDKDTIDIFPPVAGG
ncbi:MAG: MoaD family protein [Sulfolobales archaeon]|jgi:MoaD family protein